MAHSSKTLSEIEYVSKGRHTDHLTEDVVKYLTDLYTNVSKPGSLGGVEALYKSVKDEGVYSLTRRDITEFLSSKIGRAHV